MPERERAAPTRYEVVEWRPAPSGESGESSGRRSVHGGIFDTDLAPRVSAAIAPPMTASAAVAK